MGVSAKIVLNHDNSSFKKSADIPVTGIAIAMCVLGVLFYYYEYFLRVAPSVMSGELKQTFGLGDTEFGLLAAFYYYAYTPMQIPAGMMLDRMGPRKVLIFACFICAVGTYFFAATSHLRVAEAGRFLIGFGSAFAYIGVLKLSNIWLPAKYFAFIAGFCSALGMFGAISGQITMNYLVKIVGWQTALYYSAAAGIVLTGLLWLVLKNEPTSKMRHPTITDTVKQLQSVKEMMVSKQIWLNGLIGCLTFLPITVLSEVWAIDFLQAAGMTKDQAALGSAMVFLGFAIGGPLWGWVSDLVQSRRIPLIIGSFVAAILMSVVVFMPSASTVRMYTLLLLTAFFASTQILVFAISNDFTHHSARGTAAAFTNMVIMIGGGLLPPMVGKILDNANTGVLTIEHYSSALMILPVALVVSGMLSFIIKESYQKID